MSTIAMLGAGIGAGLWLIIRAISARTSLSEVGSTLASPGRPALMPVASSRSVFEQRIVVRLVELLRSVGVDPSRRAADLRVARRSVDQHVLSKLTMALVFGAVFGLLVALAGAPAGYVVLVALLAAFGGFLIPEWILSTEAAKARKGFRHAYGAYLDIVNVMLAAGSGPEAALYTAAESGGGWAFAEIRNALAAARSTQRSIAEAFAALGEELGVVELQELAASIALTGSQGARIRSSLIAKADSLRAQQIVETEGEAESATERMALPVALLLLSFIAFLGYPAVVSIGSVGG
ncbi:MAG TPA: type II secretion system F family protein [Acidimicrobiales bacterium]